MFLSVTLFLNNSVCEAAHSAKNIQERTDIIYLLNMPYINIEYIYKHILFIHLIWPILHDEHAERLYVLTNVCMHIDGIDLWFDLGHENAERQAQDRRQKIKKTKSAP